MGGISRVFATLLLVWELMLGAAEPVRVVPAGTRLIGDLATITSDIRIDGEVDGDVTSWSGDITIAGRVHGDVVSYTGSVTVLPGARIAGNALSLGGRVSAEADTLAGQRIEGGAGGRIVNRLAGVFAPMPFAASGTADLGRLLFSAALTIVLLAFCLILLGVWPQRTLAATAMLARFPGRGLLLGLLAGLALAALAPLVSALLAITLVGLPLAALAIILAHAPFVAGLATVVQTARAGIEQSQPNPASLSTASVLVTAALLLPLGLIALISPLAALGLFYLVASPGLGAMLLSRGGTIDIRGGQLSESVR